MCGILGYIGDNDNPQLIVDGLKKLEYRGYDGCGVSIVCKSGDVKIIKAKTIETLKEKIKSLQLSIKYGIGHTRWSTHGKSNLDNSHPHTDCSGKVIVTHNGIIENYIDLKEKFLFKNHNFKSETDTEVIPHILEEMFSEDSNQDLLFYFKSLANILVGSYALNIILPQYEGIIGIKKGSPLIFGMNKTEMFLSSDTNAIENFVSEVIYLEDDDIIFLNKENFTFEVFNIKTSEKVKRNFKPLVKSKLELQSRNFDHIMLKEIYEQPEIVKNLVTTYYSWNKDRDKFFNDKGEFLFDKIVMIGCGTAYHACLFGKYLIEKLTDIPVETYLGSEFRYANVKITNKTLFIPISQSGETADTLESIRLYPNNKKIAICNSQNSTLTREVDYTLYTLAGKEIAVASTKAFISQMIILYVLAYYIGKKYLPEEILELPNKIQKILDNNNIIRYYAEKYGKLKDYLYIARHLNFPIAYEGALKIKEIAYVHAEGSGAGEMKHGTLALIDKDFLTVALVTDSSVYEKMISNIQEIRAREGTVLAIATEGNEKILHNTDEVIYVPKTDEMFYPLLNTVVIQLFAYYSAVIRKCSVDMPKNLAKSVTVE